MATDVSSAFINLSRSKSPNVARMFTIAGSDYSARVAKWPKFNRAWNDIRPKQLQMKLGNGDGGMNFLREDKTLMTSECLVKMGFFISESGDEFLLGSEVGAWLADPVAETITGIEEVTNGDFSSGASWVFGTGWSIAAGVASCDGSQSTNAPLSQFNVFQQPSEWYAITYTILNYVTGTIQAFAGAGNPSPNIRSANGTYVEYIQSSDGSGDSTLSLQANSTFIADIDNVSVRLADGDFSSTDHPMEYYGEITKSPVIAGSDIMAYSGFSSSNYLEQSYDSALDLTSDIVIKAWVKWDSLNNLQAIMGNYETVTDNGGVLLYLDSAKKLRFDARSDTGTVVAASSTIQPPINEWVLIAGVRRSSGTLGLYMNGVLIASNSGSSVGTTAEGYKLGIFNSTHIRSLSGSLARARVLPVYLNTTQLKDMYDNEKASFGISESITLFSGEISNISYANEDCSLKIKDKFQQLSERQIGTSDLPISYTGSNYLVSDIAWWVVTSYGGYSTLTSSSNPDINYQKFSEWASIFSADAIFMNAEFDGQKCTEVLRKIARNTQSAIFIDNNKLTFNRFGIIDSAVTSLGPGEIKNLELSFNTDQIVNKQYIAGDYSPASDSYGFTVFDESTPSVNSFGLKENLIKDKNIWYINSSSAINLAERKILTDADPDDSVKVTTGLQGLPRIIGETLTLLDDFHSITESYRILEHNVDLDTGETSFRIDRTQLTNPFILDTTSLGSTIEVLS